MENKFESNNEFSIELNDAKLVIDEKIIQEIEENLQVLELLLKKQSFLNSEIRYMMKLEK